MPSLLKVAISALLIWAISEISRRNANIAALLAALPLISLLAMIWIYHSPDDPADPHHAAQLAQFSWSVFWYVLPSLILFILLPLLLTRWQFSFYPALAIASGATVIAFLILKIALKRFGIEL